MTETPEKYWRPRVMRHTLEDGSHQYAIHEVYFSDFGNKIDGYTVDAISERHKTIVELRESIENFIKSESKSMNCGDRRYEYFGSDFTLWLKHIDEPVIEFDET